MTMTDTTSPRIYVASLADYNAGRLHGCWIDAATDVEDIYEGVQAMLKASKELFAEEWAIHDYEGFGSYRLSEYESFERVSKIAHAIEEHGDPFSAWLKHEDDDDIDALVERFEEGYRGHFDSPKDFAVEWCMGCGWNTLTPTQLDENYGIIDWEHIAHELEIGGTFSFVDAKPYGVWVFEGNA